MSRGRTTSSVTSDPRPRVVIVGAGVGGLQAARKLARSPVHVTLSDRKNHHTFQPLLYQVATAGLSPGEIAAPIRWIVRRQRNIEVLLGEVQDFDVESCRVTTTTTPTDHRRSGAAELGGVAAGRAPVSQ